MCAESGVAGARMEAVAARAGVSKGTLYRYFESKEDLLLATLIASYEASRGRLEAVWVAGADPLAQLDLIFAGLEQVLLAVAPRMSLHYQAWGVVASDPRHESRLYGFLREFHAEHDARVRETIVAGQRSGVFDPEVDVDAVADAIDTLVGGFLYRATFDPERASPERLRACLDGLVRSALLCRPAGGGSPDA